MSTHMQDLFLLLEYFKTCFIVTDFADWSTTWWVKLGLFPSVLSMYLKKKKKTWNVKQESQDLWKQKNVLLQG